LLPDILMFDTDNDAVPVLVSVIGSGLLLTATIWLPKLNIVGDNFTTGCADSKVENHKTANTLAH
jgi:hypothetical protein